jgi:hypothetical protein
VNAYFNRYLIFLLLVVGAYVLVEVYRPKPIDWTRTYRNDAAAPFGTRAVYDLLPSLFPAQSVESVRVPVYNRLREGELPARSAYLLIGEECRLDENDQRELLAYVNRGNTAFLAANSFPDSLLRRLGVTLHQFNLLDVDRYRSDTTRPADGSATNELERYLLDTLRVNLLNPGFRQAGGYPLERETAENYFRLNDSSQVLALGTDQQNRYNFLQIRWGQGTFYLHAVPEVFANYYLLRQGDAPYAFRALSYVPDVPLLWDEFTEQGRIGAQGLFRFLFTSAPLRWAYYLTLIGVLLYVFFEGKRRQRVIPVLTPPQNTSLAFVETIGALYYQQRDHFGIAQKKITHFLAYLRQRFHLSTQTLDEEFRAALSARSGMARPEVDRLVDTIEHARQAGHLAEYQLLELNRQLESFYQRAR